MRLGKIKLNKKKIKSSYRLKTNDLIDLYDFKFKENLIETNIHELEKHNKEYDLSPDFPLIKNKPILYVTLVFPMRETLNPTFIIAGNGIDL